MTYISEIKEILVQARTKTYEAINLANSVRQIVEKHFIQFNILHSV